jgi:hypothetical protein
VTSCIPTGRAHPKHEEVSQKVFFRLTIRITADIQNKSDVVTCKETFEWMGRDEAFRATVYSMNTLLIKKGVYTTEEFEPRFCEQAINFKRVFFGKGLSGCFFRNFSLESLGSSLRCVDSQVAVSSQFRGSLRNARSRLLGKIPLAVFCVPLRPRASTKCSRSRHNPQKEMRRDPNPGRVAVCTA